MSNVDAAWDGVPSSQQHERFYRELMSADRLPSPPELAQKMLAAGDGGPRCTAGLLHDVGKLVLGLRLGETYWSMLEEAATRGESARHHRRLAAPALAATERARRPGRAAPRAHRGGGR